ncbi:MAG: sigma 54-interacting transcriptional regulator [Oscillospiraceae bacterium]|nr:sigma 54-interacting transcriptional regulator [Oscillospiraceae bacterium]
MEQKTRDYYFRQCIESFCNFIIVDNRGKIVYINDQYSKFMGLPLEKVEGRYVRDVISNTKMLEVIESGKEEIGSIMTLYDHSQKKEVTVVCNRRPIWDGDKLVGAMAETTNRDISEVESLYNKIRQMQDENSRYKAQLETMTLKHGPLSMVIGQSQAIMKVKKTIMDYADSSLPILFTGETGTGKEVFANAVQQLSKRSMNSYVKVNCAAIPKDLMESEFFGYEEGAFTGAKRGGKAGKIELADKGTLLLDEVGELPLQLQAKLLRVLQENEVERLGAVKAKPVNLRIICSTNRNLNEMMAVGNFRSDLYYRINTVEVNIPPLRDRIDDIPLLCTRFIYEINQKYNFSISGIKPEVIRLLSEHSWPGNVRELEHVLERAAVLCRSGEIDKEHLDFFVPQGVVKMHAEETAHADAAGLVARREKTERDSIEEALRRTGGNKAKAARLLAIDRSNLYSKIKKYGISSVE